MRTILITGSAGYIGSHIAHELHDQGYTLILLDIMTHRYTLERATYIQGNYGNRMLLDEIMQQHRIHAVVHCASFIDVGESVRDPLSYYHNNVAHTITLLEAMRAHDVRLLIFSSSCAVYGNPSMIPISEECTHNPVSPYGATKAMIERILADCAAAYNLRYAALRYFNVAGMKSGSMLFEYHQPETHLIPRALEAAHYGTPFTLFGTDYDTPDGTCIRDFLHVLDIARAHYHALTLLEHTDTNHVFNIGTGHGYSVREIVDAVESITGARISLIHAARRIGDPAQLIADNKKALQMLAWRPAHSDIASIIKSAYEGHTCMLQARNSAQLQCNNMLHS